MSESVLVYADYAASTPTDSRVIGRLAEVNEALVGNPSSLHGFGAAAEMSLNQSRTEIAQFLQCRPDEVYFTASGTESNNLALIGVARANRQKGNHIITSAIEHPSVLNAAQALERDGFDVTYLPVNRAGRISVEDFADAVTPETILASIHLANSEIGVIQAIKNFANIARVHGIYFHTDACQAAAWLELNTETLGVDLLTFNGGKLYGPRGVAALFVRSSVQIFPIVYGGGQEKSLRSGTENVPGIAGLAKACEISLRSRSADFKKIGQLRDQLRTSLEVLGCQINAKTAPRLPNHLSVIVPTTETNLVKALDQQGIAVSSGSACSAKSLTDSHVLAAIGLTSEQINKTIRISLGRPTSKNDIERIILALKEISQPS